MRGRALSDQDRRQLEAAGISPDAALQQLELLRSPPPPARLVRPCRAGDGIQVLAPERHRELGRRFRDAVATGRLTKFVPASGAATRMFRALLALWSERPVPDLATVRERAGREEATAREMLMVWEGLDRLPFAGELDRSLEAAGTSLEAVRGEGRLETLLAHVLTPRGLGLAERPKAFLPFHAYGEESRTALEEHFVESAGYLADADGRCRQHFTVSPAHEELFRRAIGSVGRRFRESLGVAFETSLSIQSPATDTLALTPDGEPVRTPEGRLLLRPGGHGALLGNLDRCGADLVLIKNIDNVLPRDRHGLVARWKAVLGGYLLELSERLDGMLEELEGGSPGTAVLAAGRRLAVELGTDPEALPEGDGAGAVEALRRALDRPLRVCGVVANEGEPGGGPFWVRGRDGRVRPQIVERAEIAGGDEGQQQIFHRATHFNPVDLACRLRDRHGKRYELRRWMDPEGVIVTRKSMDGARIRALERPGLWNRGMAGWSTVFVEVPGATFAPVKSLRDLLRPEHQPGAWEGEEGR